MDAQVVGDLSAASKALLFPGYTAARVEELRRDLADSLAHHEPVRYPEFERAAGVSLFRAFLADADPRSSPLIDSATWVFLALRRALRARRGAPCQSSWVVHDAGDGV